MIAVLFFAMCDFEIPLEIRNKDRAFEESFFQKKRLPIIIVLDNVRSSYNVGSVFRTADSACIEKLYLCGYTPSPPNEKVKKTALGAIDYVPWEHHPDTLQLVNYLKSEGIFTVAFETTSKSRNFFDFDFPNPCAMIFGNEKDGVGEEVLSAVDAILEVPAWGIKNSMNVANVFGIVVYEVIRQYGKSGYILPKEGGVIRRDL